MEYIIYQTTEEILVYYNEKLLLNVTTEINWAYYTTHKVYKEGVLVLICSFFQIGLKKIKRIKYQNLGIEILWKRKNFKKYLFVDGCYYGCRWHYFSKNICTITKNDQVIAKAFTTKKWWSSYFEKSDKPETSTFKVFSEDDSINFHSLIRLLIEYPSLYV
jgi:hypothetical protein